MDIGVKVTIVSRYCWVYLLKWTENVQTFKFIEWIKIDGELQYKRKYGIDFRTCIECDE